MYHHSTISISIYNNYLTVYKKCFTFLKSKNTVFRYKKCGEDITSGNMYLITTVERDTLKHYKSKMKLSGTFIYICKSFSRTHEIQ